MAPMARLTALQRIYLLLHTTRGPSTNIVQNGDMLLVVLLVLIARGSTSAWSGSDSAASLVGWLVQKGACIRNVTHARVHARINDPTRPRDQAPTRPRDQAPTRPHALLRTHAPTHPRARAPARTYPRSREPTHPCTHIPAGVCTCTHMPAHAHASRCERQQC